MQSNTRKHARVYGTLDARREDAYDYGDVVDDVQNNGLEQADHSMRRVHRDVDDDLGARQAPSSRRGSE